MRDDGSQQQAPEQDEVESRLVDAVPPSARTVVQVGRGRGWLARRLKAQSPGRVVYGVEWSTGVTSRAPAGRRAIGRSNPGSRAIGRSTPRRAPTATGLDDLFELDIESELPPLEEGGVDCIVYPGSLERLANPLPVLELHRSMLKRSGKVVCSFGNIQNHRVVKQLLRGVFLYDEDGEASVSDPAPRRLFTFAGALQLLMDAGFAPTVSETTDTEVPREFLAAGAPLFELLGVGTKDIARHLRVKEMVVSADPLPDPDPDLAVPITFVACVNDDEQLTANLLRSPCLKPPTMHDLLTFRGCSSAAEGLNAGLEGARGELVVMLHQDVYIPQRWPERLAQQWQKAKESGGEIGVAGVFGVHSRKVPFDAIGRVVHSDRLLSHGELPADVDGLDELLMVLPSDSKLRFDPSLGWHLYGTDLALQAQREGLRVVVLDALCHHNTLTNRVPTHYRNSERVLAKKWEELLPIHTNLSSIDQWLLDEDEALEAALQTQPPSTVAVGVDDDLPKDPGSDAAIEVVADMVRKLQVERAALSAELERARLEVASMKASPFWKAREVATTLRDRIEQRHGRR